MRFVLQKHCDYAVGRCKSTEAVDDSGTTVTSKELEDGIPSCADPLGHPLPMDEHAVSVSLPTWCSVVGYEEGDSSVTSKMSCGYPRFVYHPYVLQLMDHVVQQLSSTKTDDADIDCIILPTPEAAARCKTFLDQALYDSGKQRTFSSHQHHHLDVATVKPSDVLDSNNNNKHKNSPIYLHKLPAGVTAVVFPAETLAGMEAKAYWQHTGELVSSRRAECALRELGLEPKKITEKISRKQQSMVCHSYSQQCTSVHDKLKERIANLTNVPPSHVYLTPSGMSSIFTTLLSCRRLKKEQDGTSIVFGFPYLDTLKMCSRVEFSPKGCEFFGRADSKDLAKLEDLLESSGKKQQNPGQQQHHHSSYCALFTEIPSNPLLLTPNFHRLRELATEHDFCLAVDDTIGNFANVDMLSTDRGADVICTSLTKLFSGRGDVMAGSVVVNPRTETGQRMQADLIENYGKETPTLFAADAWALYHNSADFLERNDQVNATTEQLTDWLKDHVDVEIVYYPKYTDLYDQVQTGRGYGGLFSIILGSHVCQRTFFDALDIAKGPSLGTNFTLMCPYTLLAHYHELDFAMAYDIQPNLLRIAIGLESYETLKSKFEVAFDKSRLHPPIVPKRQQPLLQQQKREMSTWVAGTPTITKATPIGQRHRRGMSTDTSSVGAVARRYRGLLDMGRRLLLKK